MTLKDKILTDLTGIKNPGLLNQIFEFIQFIKDSYALPNEGNKAEVFRFAGEIDDKEANEIISSVNNEFNKIEGEW